MIAGAYINKKTTFFYLVLVDFMIAAQFVIFSVFSDNLGGSAQDWVVKSYLVSFALAFVVFGFFSDMFERCSESEEMVGQGLIFFILSNLICLFLSQPEFVVVGRTLAGLAAGMIFLGQIGTIWCSETKNFRNFSFWMILSFTSGFFAGPFIIKFISGPNLGQIEVSLILGISVAVLSIIGASRFLEKIKRSPSHLQSKKRKLAMMGVGYLGNAVIVYGFDYFLYPYVIWKFGILKGGVVMAFLSFAICYITILFYDWAKQDWLGIETIKEVKEYNGKSMIGRFTSWILKKSEPVVLVFLSIKFDPFITTAYMRKGAEKYNGLGKRDWVIFLSSLVVGNVYWTFVAYTGVSVLEYVWNDILPF